MNTGPWATVTAPSCLITMILCGITALIARLIHTNRLNPNVPASHADEPLRLLDPKA